MSLIILNVSVDYKINGKSINFKKKAMLQPFKPLAFHEK